jgi:glycosyltransferase involved in cell wall biosynthesis
MAAGLPLILTPGCNLPDLESRGAGLLTPRDPEPLAAAIGALLCDPDRRRAMGVRARAWAETSFTWPVIAAQAEQLYARLAGEHRHA